MHKERFYTIFGLFVGGAVLLTTATILFFYDVYLSETGGSYVMFFNGSLSGIDATSRITYHGVKIGEVKRIELTEDPVNHQILSPVYVRFYVEKKFIGITNPIETLVQNGFVANIKTPNLLTGISTIELVKEKKTRAYVPTRYNGYLVFPTKINVKKYNSMDATLLAAKKTFEDISAFLESSRVKDSLDATRAAANSFNQLATTLNQQVPPVLLSVNRGISQVAGAANSTQNLTDYLLQHPESIVRGR